MLQPGPGPGRDTGAPAPAPAAPPTASSAPPSPPPGQTGTGGGGWLGSLGMLLPLMLMMAVLLFITRADKKKRQQVESNLKKGDRVVTRSGLIGKITELQERTTRLEIAPGVQVTMLKNSIEGLDGGDTVASGKPAEKSDKKDAEKSDKPDDKKKK